MFVAKASKLLVVCMLTLGFWQLGQGAYIPAKAMLAQALMQRAWERASDGKTQVAPWPWADTWPVARLSARSGDIDLIVLAGSSGRTLAFAPGHMSASAMPGEVGNTVIAGHRDTHFHFLKDVALGERITIESSSGDKHHYEIVAIDIVDSRHASLTLDVADSMLSLVTCYPFDSLSAGGPLRYVVSAEEII